MRAEKTLQSFEFQISNQVPLETAFTVEMIGMGMGLLFQFGSDFRLCVCFCLVCMGWTNGSKNADAI